MNVAELKEHIEDHVQNSAMSHRYVDWINNAVMEIASDFELPALKLKEPVELTTKSTEWIYDAPQLRSSWSTSTSYSAGAKVLNDGSVYNCISAHTSGSTTEPGTGADWELKWELLIVGDAVYHKKLFMVRNGNMDAPKIYTTIGQVEKIDPDHDDTDTYITVVGVEDHEDDSAKIAVYPMADDTLYLWFYRKPVTVSDDHDIPEGIPAIFHHKVLLPKLIIQNFEIIQNMAVNAPIKSIEYWNNQLKEGLYGSVRGEIGMINFFGKSKPPRRTGGRDPLP